MKIRPMGVDQYKIGGGQEPIYTQGTQWPRSSKQQFLNNTLILSLLFFLNNLL